MRRRLSFTANVGGLDRTELADEYAVGIHHRRLAAWKGALIAGSDDDLLQSFLLRRKPFRFHGHCSDASSASG
jgi:hypothetical protein